MMGGSIPSATCASASVNRRKMLATTLCLLMAGLSPSLQAQEKSEEDLKPRAESITTKDGIELAATYFPSGLKQDASVVVFLHGLNGNQLDWGSLPKKLQDAGFAVLTVDLRGHGQSKGTTPAGDTVETKSKTKTKGGKSSVDAGSLKARDYAAMVAFDMEAVKAFIYAEHQQHKLNMNKMAIVGGGLGATVAVNYAAVDWLKKPHSDGPVGGQTPRGQDVRALVLLTPEEATGLHLTDAVKTLRTPEFQIAMLFGIGKKDRSDKGQTKKLYDYAATPKDKNEDRMYLQEYNSAARGTALLSKNGPLETHITNFLKKHVQEVNSEWRDRESKVGKKKKTE
jgi:pimeloyl-ACP methyl ester carboxylesterase